MASRHVRNNGVFYKEGEYFEYIHSHYKFMEITLYNRPCHMRLEDRFWVLTVKTRLEHQETSSR
jgi:hypothetical protein